MSQHDFNIANQGFPATRADLNLALAALASLSAGDSGPSNPYPYQLWKDTLNDVLMIRNGTNDAWESFGESIGTASPTGAIGFFAMPSAPAGWLKANGATLSRTTYSDLFAAIGPSFGAGDGATTFNVPDLRGEFLRGWDDGRGIDQSRLFGSLQLDALQNITGGFKLAGGEGGLDAFFGAFYKDGGNGDLAGNNTSLPSVGKAGFDASRVVRTAEETRPRNIALLPCIKY